MQEKLISIVVPVYNVEDYLERCINSIINQKYSALQIILVDDGSTDDSGKICDKFAMADKRITVIHKENGGLSDARNFGIDIAEGELISFVDSDDYIDYTYILKLYNLLLLYDADISTVGIRKIYALSGELKDKSKEKIKCFSGEKSMEMLLYQKKISNCACGKIYKIDLFDGIRYPIGTLYEDLGTTYKLLYKAKKVACSTEKLYFYFQRSGSIMYKKFDKKNFNRIQISQDILKWVIKNCPEYEKAAVSRFFISNIQVLREIPIEKEEFQLELKMLEQNIFYYRKLVMRDRKAKKINRCIAACSYMNVSILQKLGFLYKIIF